MKCLLLAPSRYPFIRSISHGMEALGIEVRTLDYQDFFSARKNAVYNNYTSLPKKLRRYWEEPYVRRANEEYLRIFEEYGPDLVFIYNDQLVQPETIAAFKSKSRVAFYLGDHPLYTPTNIHNLSILFASDYTITPDSFWRTQLMRMGLDNVVVDHFGMNDAMYQPMTVTVEQRALYGADLVYIGSASKTNWGYKRARFLNLFSGLDLRAYISGSMDRWYGEFPALASKIHMHDRFDPGFNNLVYNCGKLAPVEQVPSLFHGIHVRVFDALGAGILPLCEYSKDIEDVFEGIDVPLIHDYREAEALARHWITADQDRASIVERMRVRASERYAPRLVIQRLLTHLFPAWR